MTFILFCLYSNHCPVTKQFLRRNTYGQLPPNNHISERLVELLKKRSKSLSQLDTQDLLSVKPSPALQDNSDVYNEHISISRKSSREVDEYPHRIPKKRCSSADSRKSIGAESRRSAESRKSVESRKSLGGYSLGGESSHRYSEVSTTLSTTSDSDSLRRRYLGWTRRFSNYSVATSERTTLSSFIEPDAAVDLAENLMVELFDTDDIDGIIPARFLQTNQDAIVDNIREEEYSPSFSPTASCGQSSFDEECSLPYIVPAEAASELRLSTVSSPHNTSSPRSSRHSKSSSPERTDPISAYPIEGGLPRNSILSLTNMQLDTVEEETASQISPSPRVMSPRISIDNGDSFDALVDLHTKPAQPTAHRLSVPHMRKISLQREHREHHRFSVESIPVSENSFYFSVTSFDDDIVNKMEMIEDPTPSPKLDRRQRKMATVSTPNASVLQWLASMPKEAPPGIDPDEPWPFNENVSTATGSEVTMETLAVPERRISLSETSDLDSFHSCRDDYAASNISGQDSFDCGQLLDTNQTEQATDQKNQDVDEDKEGTLRKGTTLDQPSHRRQRLKQQREAIDCDDY